MRAVLRIAAVAAVALIASALAPSTARAQGQVYAPNELTVMPKLASPADVARIIRESYPENLRRARVNGTVEVEFVVGPDGRVESSTIEVVAATPPALSAPAKVAVEKLVFRPGQVKGQPVRTRVALPLVYRAS
ncbi:MAG TPA: energy transducer TonB [Gemmatimonadaceae bacterium]|nr:energy transducer TonB [Gemmatimonadaceae bacterium]